MNTIHIYGQEVQHEDVWIVADRESMKSLCRAIGDALISNKDTSVLKASVNDGEGYDIHIKIDSRVNSDSYSVPYSHGSAKEKRKYAIHPWQSVQSEA